MSSGRERTVEGGQQQRCKGIQPDVNHKLSSPTVRFTFTINNMLILLITMVVTMQFSLMLQDNGPSSRIVLPVDRISPPPQSKLAMLRKTKESEQEQGGQLADVGVETSKDAVRVPHPVAAKTNENYNADPKDERYFSACMLTMDDNHFWPEFLAYHYTFLNMRRLIVAIDPRSRTSPARVFDKWNGLINITTWSDEDFIYDCEKYGDDLTDLHRCRQRRLYHKCTEALKKEQGTKWIAYTDVDEYIVPNWRAGPLELISEYQPEMNIFDIFDSNPHLNNYFHWPCFPMSRIPVGILESLPEEVTENVPVGIDAEPLMTLRFRYIRFLRKTLPGKCLVDITKVPSNEIRVGNHDTHRPITTRCDEKDVWMNPWNSAFMVFHYAGTLEAFQFRDDPRKEDRRTAQHYYKLYNDTLGAIADDSARFWISNFVSKVGMARAQELLEGAGVAEAN
jgi:hypothetical protein